MVLKLNSPKEPDYLFEEHYGRINEEIEKINDYGRGTIMNSAHLMQRKILFRNGPKEVKSAYMDHDFDTADVMLIYPNEKVKVVLDCPLLKTDVHSWRCWTHRGGINVCEEEDGIQPGEVFTRREIKRFGGLKYVSKEGAKSNPILRILARDQRLLDDFVDLIFAESKARFGYDHNLRFYARSYDGENDLEQMRPIRISRLECKSAIFTTPSPLSPGGRIVEIHPDAFNEDKTLKGLS